MEYLKKQMSWPSVPGSGLVVGCLVRWDKKIPSKKVLFFILNIAIGA